MWLSFVSLMWSFMVVMPQPVCCIILYFIQSINILLEGVPSEINIESLRNDLLALDGVQGIHQLKVWAITSKNVHLTAHLIAPDVDQRALYHQAVELLGHEHGITQVTLQIEEDECHPHQHEHSH